MSRARKIAGSSESSHARVKGPIRIGAGSRWLDPPGRSVAGPAAGSVRGGTEAQSFCRLRMATSVSVHRSFPPASSMITPENPVREFHALGSEIGNLFTVIGGTVRNGPDLVQCQRPASWSSLKYRRSDSWVSGVTA